MTKADAIRAVTAADISLSNSQIKELVRKRYGLHCETNQIISIVGSEESRRNGKAFDLARSIALRYLKTIGCYAYAIRLLRLVRLREGK